MTSPRKIALLTGAGLLLVAAIAVQVYATRAYPYVSTLGDRSLGELLPAQAAGWTVLELPIAQSDAAVGNVERILRYDDVVFRRYSRGSVNVDVYVAYWLPGKMSYWDVGSHNPDSCWVYNGFTRLNRVHGKELDDPSLPLKPFEYGHYEQNGNRIDVMFWHLVGGEPNRYEEQAEGWRDGLSGRIERFPLMVKDIRNYGLDMHREQFFVRISSNTPLIPLLQDPEFRALLKDMRETGILREIAPVAADSGSLASR
jgi:hypothetical protein